MERQVNDRRGPRLGEIHDLVPPAGNESLLLILDPEWRHAGIAGNGASRRSSRLLRLRIATTGSSESSTWHGDRSRAERRTDLVVLGLGCKSAPANPQASSPTARLQPSASRRGARWNSSRRICALRTASGQPAAAWSCSGMNDAGSSRDSQSFARPRLARKRNRRHGGSAGERMRSRCPRAQPHRATSSDQDVKRPRCRGLRMSPPSAVPGVGRKPLGIPMTVQARVRVRSTVASPMTRPASPGTHPPCLGSFGHAR